MRILILDDDFNTIGSISLFLSLIWCPRYAKLGYFELHCPTSYFSILRSGKYVYRNDRDNLGVIDDIQYAQTDAGEKTCYVKGNFAETLLADKVISKTATVTGNLEIAMRKMVTDFAISPANGEPIPNLILGELSGLADTVDTQVTGDNLSEWLYDVGNAAEISHRIRYDYLNNQLIFEVWKGKDRTDSQTENSWAIFSNSFCNIKSVQYEKNTSSYKNYAYVAGEGEGADRVIVEVDTRASPDEMRREIWVDARDLQKQDSDGNTMTDAQYKVLLTSRGKEKLKEYPIVETVNSDIDAQANLVYREDFDYGDLCSYINTEIGVETEKRITEIMEVYEGGSEKISVTFGTDEIETVEQLIKREVT